jgi:hypothetical protein
MTSDRFQRPRPVDLLRLTQLMEADQAQSFEALRRRDRAIGRQLENLARDPALQLRAWMDRVDSAGAGAQGVQRALSLVLTVLGLLAGWGAALAAFYYEGSGRVNVVAVLGVLVGLQLALLACFCVAALPSSALGWLPGGEALIDAMGSIAPGRLWRIVARWMPQAGRQSMEALGGHGLRHGRAFARVHKWMVLRWSQAMAVAFNGAAIATAFSLVVFTDLAFGWSTTLRIEPVSLHGLAAGIAWPWSGLLPAAVPSLELVEYSRYFRLDAGGAHIASANGAALLGDWWPFVLTCMLVYGLGLRLVAYFFTAWRLQRATRDAFLHAPGVPALLERLNTALVETRSDERGEAGGAAPCVGAGDPAQPMAGPCQAINWADVPLSDPELIQALAQSAGLAVSAVHRAGGVQAMELDREVVDAVAADPDKEGIAVVTKAWEPPLMELVDFLVALRAGVPGGLPIAVVPVRVEDGGLRPPSEREIQPWRRRIQAIGDPWLRVTSIG